MFDDVVVVYKFIGDLMFYATGAADENEVIIAAVLQVGAVWVVVVDW